MAFDLIIENGSVVDGNGAPALSADVGITGGLAGRGEIREGYKADICVFDPDQFIDLSSFEDPMLHPLASRTSS